VDPGAAVTLIAHGGTAGVVVEVALLVGLVVVFVAAWLGFREDEEEPDTRDSQ
jgi:hypothetical protein